MVMVMEVRGKNYCYLTASLPSDCGFSASKIVFVAVVDWEAANERINRFYGLFRFTHGIIIMIHAVCPFHTKLTRMHTNIDF